MVLPMDEADGPGAGRWPRIRQLALLAEAGGIDSLWVYDHLVFRLAGEDEDGIHEAWTLLSALAAVNERAELGMIVLGRASGSPRSPRKWRRPSTRSRTAGCILGLGTGWHEPEYTAFGYPFDHRVGRFRNRCESSSAVARRAGHVPRHLARDGRRRPHPAPIPAGPSAGRLSYPGRGQGRTRRASPRAGRTPGTRPGSGCRTRALRRAARRTSVAACEAEGRDPSAITVTVGITVGG